MAAGRSGAARWFAHWRRSGGTPGVLQPGSAGAVTFPSTPLRCLVEIAPGADLTADPSTWIWVDITQWVRHDLGISTTVGRRDQAGVVDPSRATLKLDNRDGRFSRRNPLGPYYGQLTRNTPIRMAVDPGDGMHYRYHGFVNEWPKRWDKSGNDSTVTIQCGGQLRRMQRSQPLRPALFRTMTGISSSGYTPDAYWTMEDGRDASRFLAETAGIGAAIPLVINIGLGGNADNVSFAGSSDFAGSGAVAELLNDNGVFFPETPYADTGRWTIQQAIYLTTEVAGSSYGVNFTAYAGPDHTFVVQIFPGLNFFRITSIQLSTGSSVFTVSDTISEADVLDVPMSLVYQSSTDAGGTFTAQLMGTDGVVIASATTTGTGIHSALRRFNVQTGRQSFGVGTLALGHVAVFTTDEFAIATDSTAGARATGGWNGEQAHERIIRLCREEGVPLRCVAGRSAALGPQPAGTLLDVLRDAERADFGVLYEHEFGVGYRALREYYNQPVSMALDFDAGHVNDPPEADDSDLRFRNQWTARRSGGSSVTVLDPDYSTAQGLYEASTTINVETDEQLAHVAGWLVHRDTADEDYWTGLKLSFARTPDIIPAWAALPFGSRLTVANPPTQADPGSIDAIVEGWSERWDTVTWEATLNTSPASVYRVGVYDDTGSRYDSQATTLAEDLDTSETGVDVAVASGNVGWITTALHPTKFPFDVGVGGEQMTVTAAVDNGGGSYTFTVTRSANGITKTHSSGAQVRLWRPARYAL